MSLRFTRDDVRAVLGRAFDESRYRRLCSGLCARPAQLLHSRSALAPAPAYRSVLYSFPAAFWVDLRANRG